MGERIERAEARIGERLDRAGQDRKDMEARIGERFDRVEAHLLAAVQRPAGHGRIRIRVLNLPLSPPVALAGHRRVA